MIDALLIDALVEEEGEEKEDEEEGRVMRSEVE